MGFRTLQFATVLVAALSPAFAKADMAVSCLCGRDDNIHLYYVDAGSLVRAICPLDTTLFDRSTCRDVVTSLPVMKVIDSIDAAYDREPTRLMKLRDEFYAKVVRTDLKIDEYLAGSLPTAPVDELEAELKAQEAARQALTVAIKDLEDQVARIQARLATTPNADLAQQLAAVVQELSTRRTELSDKDARLTVVRRQLVDAYATLASVQDFKDLVHARFSFGMQLDGANASLKDAMAALVVAKRHEQKLFDQDYVWETLNYSRDSSRESAFAAQLEGAFERVSSRHD